MNSSPVPLDTVALTVGTAGHVDHGKTSLVKFFTGCETDRLPEEKRRGMTIDLGFATCTLPNNRRIGIVDVPGHERFVHNMVAGATGIDVVLLVVAADDGVMPQTLEHFHIVRLLGVSSGLVALTKIDLACPERVAEVRRQIEEMTAGSFLEGCPIVPVSSRTGEGFEAFYRAFVATVDRTAERDASGPFRLHAERSFVLPGIGVIVSGIPASGSVRVGDTVELLPARSLKKVRGIEVYGRAAEQGSAGECVALRLQSLSRDEVPRGTVIAEPGRFSPVRFVNVRFHHLRESSRPLKRRTPVRVHVGTTVALADLMLPSAEPLPPGHDTYAQIQLKQPVVAATGDFFVARLLSPVRTIGGGCVVSAETQRMRRTQGNWVEECAEHERAFRQPETAVLYVLERAGDQALRLTEIARRALRNRDAARAALAAFVADGRAVVLPGERYALARRVDAAVAELVAALNRLHDERPLSFGFARRDLLPGLAASREVSEYALNRLVDTGAVAAGDAGFYLPDRKARLSPGQTVMANRIAALYRDAGYTSARREELPAVAGAPAAVLDPIVDFLIQSGDLVVVSDKVILHRDVLADSRRRILEHFKTHASLESGAFRDVLGTTRKYAVAVLEYWDRQGLTRRQENARFLRE